MAAGGTLLDTEERIPAILFYESVRLVELVTGWLFVLLWVVHMDSGADRHNNRLLKYY